MPRVLIIDDHPVVREGIGRVLGGDILDAENAHASTAAHLQSAIAAASFIRDVMWDADSKRLLRR